MSRVRDCGGRLQYYTHSSEWDPWVTVILSMTRELHLTS